MSDTNLPGNDWEDDAGGSDDGALNDPLLRRALAHAPDHANEPEERLRASIRTLAHEAVAPSLPEGPVGAARPWWQRLLGIGGGGGSSMPWNAAFATVLVGVLVTVMWQREPVPGAQVDRPMQDRAVAQPPVPAPVPTPAPVSPAAPAAPATAPQPAEPSSPAKPAPPNALDAALAESRAVTEASNRALDAQDRERERLAKETAAARAATAAAEQAADKALQKALAAEQAKEQAKAQTQRQADGVAEASPPAPPLVASRRAVPPPPPPPSPATLSAPAAPAAPAAPMAEAVTPTFEALSQWTQLRITRSGGVSRSLPRDEARELGALVGSVALAGVGAQPFTGAVDWRIALERNGRVLAVLELAGGQVSWREGSLSATTGRPGADSLSALRQALEEAAR